MKGWVNLSTLSIQIIEKARIRMDKSELAEFLSAKPVADPHDIYVYNMWQFLVY